ncbi:hypothetical protein ABZ476_24920, partial [Streptomyces albogriseolus]
ATRTGTPAGSTGSRPSPSSTASAARWLTRPFDLTLGEPAHFIMQTRQFHNLRTRVGKET